MFRSAFGLTFAILLALTGDAHGQQHMIRSFHALARAADAVVLGRCEVGTSAWEGTPSIIITRHQCSVERTFKGAPENQITVAVLGGRVGDVSMGASAGARITPATDSVMLLQRSAFGPYYVVTGGTAGLLPVVTVGSERTVRGMSLDAFAHAVQQ